MIAPLQPPRKQIASAWKEQIRQVAARNPRLAQELWRNRQAYFERYAYFYRQLAALPRKYRRRLLRRMATTLAGAALLLALGQALPAQAATITVDGVTCTLAEAITSANNDDAAGNGCVDGNGADVIDLQTDVTLSALLPPITSEITLEGNGYTIDGNDAFRVLSVQVSGNLTLNNASISDGKILGSGGGIYNQGALILNNSNLIGNNADVKGGGIWNVGTLTVNNSVLTSNLAAGNTPGIGGGGGIFNSGTLTVNDSTLSGNTASSGAGIANIDGVLMVNNSALSGNTASSSGGGIINIHINNLGIVTLYASTLSGNSANSGGGIFNNGTLTVTDSLLSGNTALSGGGIYNEYSLTVTSSTLSNNSAIYFAGGIEANHGTVIMNNSTLSGNNVFPGYGGAIEIFNGATVIVNNSTLSGNSANSYGGAIRNTYGTLAVNNSTLSGNTTNGKGGGIHNRESLTLINRTRSGEGIDNNLISNSILLNGSLISGNQAASGPEVYAQSEIVTANNYNVVGYGGDARSVGFTPGSNDIIPPGVLNTVLDTTLANNGGSTLTHALVSGSVAIDTAPNAPCLAPPINGIDQRGFPRNVDGNGIRSRYECDAGAFEFGPAAPPTPTPRPTRTPTPTQTPVPLALNQGDSLSTGSADEASNSFVRFFTVTLLTLGSLLFFRRWPA